MSGHSLRQQSPLASIAPEPPAAGEVGSAYIS